MHRCILFALSGLFTCAAVAQDAPIDAPAIFQQRCAQCHGDKLQGGNAQSMIDGVWQFGAGGGLKNNIKHGITHLGMPAFEAVLSDAEIGAVADYILEAEHTAGAVKPPPPTHLQTLDYEVNVETWVEGLNSPWAIDFLDNDTALITEKPGGLRVVRQGKLEEAPVSGTPAVLYEGQGGLLDVAADPEYAENGWIYLAYSHVLDEPGENPPAMTRIVRGKIENNTWTGEEVLFEAEHEHYLKTRHHYGSRIVFDHKNNLYFSIGERGLQDHAQDLSRPNGKVHRIRRDGSIPRDNPFKSKSGALKTIYTYGNRNPQGLAIHPETGQLWATEHGPMGGDELNLLQSGLNYGWPLTCYGRNYDGRPISEFTSKPGIEDATHYWRPSVGVCGLDFYRGEAFKKWQGHLLAGALRYESVELLTVAGERVLHSETILKNAGRVRDVSSGPDGAVYVVLNGPDVVLRLYPEAERAY
ncbi:MAG: PQQ-dependent sugar dehydrogenase [Candidatus Hydrogenedentes bacterium]|nr:PQQ-dependent sugar dehydrogenase [Candidatus Hydrogenedentota bacterium]